VGKKYIELEKSFREENRTPDKLKSIKESIFEHREKIYFDLVFGTAYGDK